MINAGTYLIWAYIAGATFLVKVAQRFVARDVPRHPARSRACGELAVFCGAMVGAGIGFLWYNTYPAQVFMGDVGSLALGGGLGMLAVFTKNELLSIMLGGIFFVETRQRHHAGGVVQAHRQARLPDGADPPPLREEGVAGAEDHRALLDHLHPARAREPVVAEAAVTAI